MASFAAVTDDELARARRDRAFRQRLLTDQLGALIEEMNRRKRGLEHPSAASEAQLREAAELAVRVADLITHLDKQAK